MVGSAFEQMYLLCLTHHGAVHLPFESREGSLNTTMLARAFLGADRDVRSRARGPSEKLSMGAEK